MKKYEQISEKCKIWWADGIDLTNEKYTQVSGYIFNEENQLLIVKNDKNWTIPGGHPELDEKPIETLKREVMEEACTTIKEIYYLGAVGVIEDDKIYYQLRYTAKIDEIEPFKKDWETTERLFVDLADLHKYITWANGITFSLQIESAKKFWSFIL